MKFTNEFYDKLTPEELERNVEFIDWKLVPDHLITEEFKAKFSCFKTFAAIMWFRNIVNSFDIKIPKEEGKYKRIYFFLGEIAYMEYDIEIEKLWCSEYFLWSIFRDRYKIEYSETREIVKIIVEKQLRILYPIHECFSDKGIIVAEKYFKNIDLDPAQDLFDCFTAQETELDFIGVTTLPSEHFSKNAIN